MSLSRWITIIDPAIMQVVHQQFTHMIYISIQAYRICVVIGESMLMPGGKDTIALLLPLYRQLEYYTTCAIHSQSIKVKDTLSIYCSYLNLFG